MNIWIIILVVYIILILITPKKYKWYLPTIPVYPNNEKEVILVKQAIKNQNKSDLDFHNLIDSSVAHAFAKMVPDNQEQLRAMYTKFHIQFTILFFKYLINRPRPIQIDPSLNVDKSNTSNTPSYPAGHAFQAYYLAKILGKKYPYLQQQLDNLAYQCDVTRVKAGLHFPSDGQFSKTLVDTFF